LSDYRAETSSQSLRESGRFVPEIFITHFARGETGSQSLRESGRFVQKKNERKNMENTHGESQSLRESGRFVHIIRELKKEQIAELVAIPS